MPATRRSNRVFESKGNASRVVESLQHHPYKATSVAQEDYFYSSISTNHTRPITNTTLTTNPKVLTTLKFDPIKGSDVPIPIDWIGTWPPISATSLMNVDTDLSLIGTSRQQKAFLRRNGEFQKPDCIGQSCWYSTFCTADFDSSTPCTHTFAEWSQPCSDWQSRFEIRPVGGMGYGLFTTHAWKTGDILGPYLGELLPYQTSNTDYCHEVSIGPEFTRKRKAVAYVDAEDAGTFVGFANHSCENNAVIVEARVGSEHVLVVVAMRAIGVGSQVCVDYREDYFRGRLCLCTAKECRYTEKMGSGEALAP